jgi:hypothetical protein
VALCHRRSPDHNDFESGGLPKIGRVIHGRVENIPVPGCAGIHLTNSIDHIALTEKMMRKSTNDLLRENTDLPDAYFEGYREWQKQKKPQIGREMTIADVPRRNADLPLICNLLPAKTAESVSTYVFLNRRPATLNVPPSTFLTASV